jgi:hypothetical protein
MATVRTNGPIYKIFASTQKPRLSKTTRDCCVRTVHQLLSRTTSDEHPGMLLGKIQSGKTRTFMGVVSLAFDNGFDLAVVFTKGTRALTRQTVARVKQDLAPALAKELVLVYDIRSMQDNLTDWELSKKLVIVCKKEDDNLKKLSEYLLKVYPVLKDRRTLFIDDEADFASIGYRRTGGIVTANVIPVQISDLRSNLSSLSFLQVTATPYSLYLQPEGEIDNNATGPIKPVRPTFTELVPVHDGYVGGEYYFEKSQQENSVPSFLHVDVPATELDILKKPDRTLFKLEECLSSNGIATLRRALVSFIVGACVRRIHQSKARQPQRRYSFIVHTETSRNAHSWQKEVVTRLIRTLQEAVANHDSVVSQLVSESYVDLKQSLKRAGLMCPKDKVVLDEACKALSAVMTTTVNSEREIDQLLDDSGQLMLRTPINVFIGGQILDRGLTIENLIGFFYGRRPKTAQQDTVLQHSRMYGNRDHQDLAVTRFYTSAAIYRSMQMIHDFDSALRSSFEAGGHNAGVVFLRSDPTRGVVSCSPNKTLKSNITSVRAGTRLLVPAGFTTKQAADAKKATDQVDRLVKAALNGDTSDNPGMVLIDADTADKIVDAIHRAILCPDDAKWDVKSFKATMRYLAANNTKSTEKGKIVLLVRRNRDLARIRPADNRLQNAPDSRVETKAVDDYSKSAPALLLYRQNGKKSQKWEGTPFWWPVLRAPAKTPPIIFASNGK